MFENRSVRVYRPRGIISDKRSSAERDSPAVCQDPNELCNLMECNSARGRNTATQCWEESRDVSTLASPESLSQDSQKMFGYCLNPALLNITATCCATFNYRRRDPFCVVFRTLREYLETGRSIFLSFFSPFATCRYARAFRAAISYSIIQRAEQP